jgi:hypothetical protein
LHTAFEKFLRKKLAKKTTEFCFKRLSNTLEIFFKNLFIIGALKNNVVRSKLLNLNDLVLPLVV